MGGAALTTPSRARPAGAPASGPRGPEEEPRPAPPRPVPAVSRGGRRPAPRCEPWALSRSRRVARLTKGTGGGAARAGGGAVAGRKVVASAAPRDGRSRAEGSGAAPAAESER